MGGHGELLNFLLSSEGNAQVFYVMHPVFRGVICLDVFLQPTTPQWTTRTRRHGSTRETDNCTTACSSSVSHAHVPPCFMVTLYVHSALRCVSASYIRQRAKQEERDDDLTQDEVTNDLGLNGMESLQINNRSHSSDKQYTFNTPHPPSEPPTPRTPRSNAPPRLNSAAPRPAHGGWESPQPQQQGGVKRLPSNSDSNGEGQHRPKQRQQKRRRNDASVSFVRSVKCREFVCVTALFAFAERPRKSSVRAERQQHG